MSKHRVDIIKSNFGGGTYIWCLWEIDTFGKVIRASESGFPSAEKALDAWKKYKEGVNAATVFKPMQRKC